VSPSSSPPRGMSALTHGNLETTISVPLATTLGGRKNKKTKNWRLACLLERECGGGHSAQADWIPLHEGTSSKSFSIGLQRHCAGPLGDRRPTRQREQRARGLASGGSVDGQAAQPAGTHFTGRTAALRPRLVKVKIQQPSAGTSLQTYLYTPSVTRRYVQEDL